MGWITFCYHRLLEPLQRARRALNQWERWRDPGTRLIEYVDHVIFLGAIESEFNSACWDIFIDDHDYTDFCHLWLTIPSDGIIEDIAPWNSGFELIRARTQYEQPWRACVQYRPNTRVPQFQVPAFPQYVIPRILGMGECGPLMINYPYEKYGFTRLDQFREQDSIQRYMANRLLPSNQNLQDIDLLPLRHLEQLTDWHTSPWKYLVSPPAPPLLPPIKLDHGYKYLLPNTKVLFYGHNADQTVFEVSGYEGLYQLMYAENEPGYKWDYLTPAIANQVLQENQAEPNFNWKEWTRYSVDHKWYIKMVADPGYHTKMLVLQELQ